MILAYCVRRKKYSLPLIVTMVTVIKCAPVNIKIDNRKQLPNWKGSRLYVECLNVSILQGLCTVKLVLRIETLGCENRQWRGPLLTSRQAAKSYLKTVSLKLLHLLVVYNVTQETAVWHYATPLFVATELLQHRHSLNLAARGYVNVTRWRWWWFIVLSSHTQQPMKGYTSNHSRVWRCPSNAF